MKNWNTEIQWPTLSDFMLRCIEESFGPSSGGNPMITLKFEVVAPTEVEIAGEMYNIAGIPLTFWNVTQTMNGNEIDQEKSKNNETRTKDLYEKFGLDKDNIDYQNPSLGFKGKVVYAMLVNKEDAKRRAPTAEQLAKGIKIGDPLVDPITRKEIKSNYPRIERFFGLVPEDRLAGIGTGRAF